MGHIIEPIWARGLDTAICLHRYLDFLFIKTMNKPCVVLFTDLFNIRHVGLGGGDGGGGRVNGGQRLWWRYVAVEKGCGQESQETHNVVFFYLEVEKDMWGPALPDILGVSDALCVAGEVFVAESWVVRQLGYQMETERSSSAEIQKFSVLYLMLTDLNILSYWVVMIVMRSIFRFESFMSSLDGMIMQPRQLPISLNVSWFQRLAGTALMYNHAIQSFYL
ncbi:hypothetical protein QVD17_38021 [Tagetes erecta]|uniref:Uncharacterized protein n=1 Tax=Tagetes erecta TaxID=13708 RepID=A0AAD8JVS5_TARER|nr:hypothetical protein QVD17_38021 [Tagetes erecta]